MITTLRVGDVAVLSSAITVPGLGTLPINSFVLLAQQPMLIDTGLVNESDEFMAALRAVIDPAELRWIWITHDDGDHIGSFQAAVNAAPDARVAIHAFGALRTGTMWPIPLDRVYALSPGDRFDLGDRTVVACKPPTYDNPTSTGVFDTSTSTLFSVDSFGAILPEVYDRAADVPAEELAGGMAAWTSLDSPWSHISDRSRFGATLDDLRRLGPARIFGSHLAPAAGQIDQFIDIVASVPDMDPVTAPDADTFAAIAAQMMASG